MKSSSVFILLLFVFSQFPFASSMLRAQSLVRNAPRKYQQFVVLGASSSQASFANATTVHIHLF